MVISAVVWVLMLKPEIFTRHKLLVSVWIATEALAMLVGWIKFRRVANLHLYLNQAASVAGYVFVVYAFMIGYSEAFFYVTIVLLIMSSLECLLIQLLSRSVDEHMKSIIHAYWLGRLF